jgi:GNAT superfamily N-acetyltransferase
MSAGRTSVTTTANGLIRPADDADLQALVQFGPEGLYRERLAHQAAGNGALLTFRLTESGRPEGVVYVWWADAEEHEVRWHLPDVPLLMQLKVSQNMRGWGIGTMLVTAAEELVVNKRGRDRIALGVGPDNHRAIRLYQKLGYEEWEHGLVVTHRVEYRPRRRRRYDENCLMFVKRLVPVTETATAGRSASLLSAVAG